MSNINLIVERMLNNKEDPANLFDNGRPNENAKYTPKFLNKIKGFQKATLLGLDFSKLFKLNPKTHKGTEISIDADEEEREADAIMRKDGLLK